MMDTQTEGVGMRLGGWEGEEGQTWEELEGDYDKKYITFSNN